MADDEIHRRMLDELPDGVYFVDRHRLITYWNKSAATISGYSRDEVMGRWCGDGLLRHVDENGKLLCGDGCPLTATMTDGLPREAEVFLHHKEGHRVSVRVRASPIRSAEGEIVGAVEVFSSNSEDLAIRERVSELERAALLDPVTNLGNRRYGELQLGSTLGEQRRFGRAFGVLFFDVDNFKAVNDAHGHETGDRVLRSVARTAQASLRAFDVLCRWGGDEFLALIVHVDPVQLQAVAEKIRILVETSGISVGDQTLRPTLSVGGALGREGDTATAIVARADGQMYRSKEAGGNRVSVVI
jgi:diguanylate cyclase (GGDEF)-like protein/PAS domain S-box-containing protein